MERLVARLKSQLRSPVTPRGFAAIFPVEDLFLYQVKRKRAGNQVTLRGYFFWLEESEVSMKPLRTFAILTLAVLVTSPLARAHHGLSLFDATHIVTLEGTTQGFEWINPHPHIYLDVTDAKGMVTRWLLECGSPLMLTRFG